MSRAPAGDGLLLPILSGVLLFLACPPAELLLPSFIALAPLLVYIAERDRGPGGRWAATRAGLLTGVVYFGLQLHWMALALAGESPLAVPAFVLTVLLLAALVGAFGLAVHFVRDRLGTPLAVAAACFWTSLEWAQGNLGDLAFPWLGLGTTLAPFPRVAGAADLVGALGLTTWLAATSGLVAELVLRLRSGPSSGDEARRAAPEGIPALLLITLVVAGAPVAYGFWRAETLALSSAARVAVVQPDLSRDVRRDPAVAVDSSLSALRALTPMEGGLDLVVWPEVAVPATLDTATTVRRAIEEISRSAGAPILTGAYGLRDVDRGSAGDGGHVGDVGDVGGLGNAAFLVGGGGFRAGPGSGGRAVGMPRYLKRRLVPFIERVPLGAALRGVGDALVGTSNGPVRYGDLRPGAEGPLLETANGADFGVLICFESTFADLSREYRADGADFLVNITNDAWYGDAGPFGRTVALWQHPAHMVLRAIETRAGVVRAANTGFSLLIDPLGRVRASTDLFSRTTLAGPVLTTDVTPLYIRWGDWLPRLSLLAGLALLGLAASKRVWQHR
ncbi:MAG TPA: apolipoprotein N-acyltransferase [Longimicrobiales bacterium]|nr:apolipoprotein N-acyltransferase [Longimicrobiales bacterium]